MRTPVPDEVPSSYYQRNADALRAKRRKKYAENPEYREQQKEAARRRRAENATPTTVTFAGKTFEVVRAVALAEAVGRSKSTINIWESSGVLPQTPFRSPGGFRLYTEDMVQAVVDACANYSRPTRSPDEFRSAVVSAWMSLGIPM